MSFNSEFIFLELIELFKVWNYLSRGFGDSCRGFDENSKLLQHEASNPPSTHATLVQNAKYFYVSQNDIGSPMPFNSEFKFLELIELCPKS